MPTLNVEDGINRRAWAQGVSVCVHLSSKGREKMVEKIDDDDDDDGDDNATNKQPWEY